MCSKIIQFKDTVRSNNNGGVPRTPRSAQCFRCADKTTLVTLSKRVNTGSWVDLDVQYTTHRENANQRKECI